jgi:hypothetical protein
LSIQLLFFKVFFSKSKCCGSGQLFQILLSIVFASQHSCISACCAIFYFLIFIDQIEATNELFISFKSAYEEKYIPSKLMTVIVSSIKPIFKASSYLVFEVIEGPPLTSSSHALPFESKIKSNPYNSKDRGECVTSFYTALRDLIMHLWISWNDKLVAVSPNLESMYFLSS